MSLSCFNEARSERPSTVYFPENLTQLREALLLARTDGTFAVHATGHSFTADSLSSDTVISLQRMNSASLTERGLLTIQGGTTTATAAAAVGARGLALSVGTSGLVGLPGLAHGGGIAYTSRSHGLTCDALVSCNLMTYDGELLAATDEHTPELMWALRGGGAGLLGVTVAAEFRLFKTPTVTTVNATYEDASASDLMRAQQALTSAPDTLGLRFGVQVTAESPRPTLTLAGQGYDLTAGQVRDYLAGHGFPNLTLTEQSYGTAMAMATHQTSGGAFRISGRLIDKPQKEGVFDALLESVRRWPTSTNPDGAGFAMFAWGGAVTANKSKVNSCFPHRSTLYQLSIDSSWNTHDAPEAIEDQQVWVEETLHNISSDVGPRQYLNFWDPAGTSAKDALAAVYGNSTDRLAKLIHQYNPDLHGSGRYQLMVRGTA